MDLWRVAKALVGHGKGLRLPTTDDDHPADPAACSSVGWLGALWLPLVFNQLLRRQRNCVGYVRSEQSRSLKSFLVLPPQIFGLFGPPKKRKRERFQTKRRTMTTNINDLSCIFLQQMGIFDARASNNDDNDDTEEEDEDDEDTKDKDDESPTWGRWGTLMHSGDGG